MSSSKPLSENKTGLSSLPIQTWNHSSYYLIR
jgi:hypothetical protein